MHALTQHNPISISRRLRKLVFAAPLGLAVAFSPLAALAETGIHNADGVDLHFVDEGTGEAVIYLHGFAGSSDMWSAVGLLPLEGFRTVAFDARGHGRSDKPEEAGDYGARLVEDVIGLMNARGIEQAHIVGYSMGAETALALAANHHDRVLSVVAAGSGLSGEPEAQAYGFIAGALAEVDTFGSFMASMAPPDQELPPEAQAAMLDLLSAHGIDPGQPAASLAAVAASLPEIISLDAKILGTIEVPVLGIAGEEDPERGNIEALVDALPSATVTVIAGTDHLTAPVDPEFAQAVTAFLAN